MSPHPRPFPFSGGCPNEYPDRRDGPAGKTGIAEKTDPESRLRVVSNAACKVPSGSLSRMFQAGALIELSGDYYTACEIYFETYDIPELPAAQTDGG